MSEIIEALTLAEGEEEQAEVVALLDAAEEPEVQSGDHLGTPSCVLVVVEEMGSIAHPAAPIALDPCSNRWSIVRARVALDGSSLEQDGLAADWHKLARGGLIYVNPPYGRGCMRRWGQKVIAEAQAGGEIILLTKGDHSVKWWHTLRTAADAICYWSERIHFRGGETGANFPSAVWYFGPRAHLFAHVFSQAGDVRVLR